MEREITLAELGGVDLAVNRTLNALMDAQGAEEGSLSLRIGIKFGFFPLNQHETGTRPVFKITLKSAIKDDEPMKFDVAPDAYLAKEDGRMKLVMMSEQMTMEGPT